MGHVLPVDQFAEIEILGEEYTGHLDRDVKHGRVVDPALLLADGEHVVPVCPKAGDDVLRHALVRYEVQAGTPTTG